LNSKQKLQSEIVQANESFEAASAFP